MENNSKKEQLIEDIEQLLNKYPGQSPTFINPDLLSYMDEQSLIAIIDSLLQQKEQLVENVDIEWLEQFKCEK